MLEATRKTWLLKDPLVASSLQETISMFGGAMIRKSMSQKELVGKAQTVLGVIPADSLGITLPHEHLLTDLSAYFVEPSEASDKKMAHEPVTLENLYWVKPHCLTSLDDLKLIDEHVATKEAMMFKLAGGNTIVEVSNIGLARDPLGLARIARATGLNIIMGSGYYIAASHPPELSKKSEEQIAEEITRDIFIGVGNTGIHAGVIGEIGCSVPLEDDERKVLRAAAIAQQQTGAALYIHPSCCDDLVPEILDFLGKAGANLSRTVICHVDAWCFSPATCRHILDVGCYIEYDTFGSVGIFPLFLGHYLDWPSDAKRINDVITLANEGYLNRILISQDHCFKHLLTSYGGYGYAHILRDVLPVMLDKGVSEEQIHALLVENPKRLLSFVQV